MIEQTPRYYTIPSPATELEWDGTTDWNRLKQRQAPCHDCRDKDHEIYMIVDDLWQSAVEGQEVRYLCFLCLERRLGRTLEPSCFKAVPINFEPRIRSIGLWTRMLWPNPVRGTVPSYLIRESDA